MLFCILQSINFRCQIENQVSDYRLLGASSLSMDSLIRYTIEYKQMLCSSIGVIVLFELEYLIKKKKKKKVCMCNSYMLNGNSSKLQMIVYPFICTTVWSDLSHLWRSISPFSLACNSFYILYRIILEYVCLLITICKFAYHYGS